MTRWFRLALMALLVLWTVRLASGMARGCFLDLVNLAFHEAGHLLCAPLGSTLHYLGGTLGQLAVPVLLAAYFLSRGEQPFAAACCTWWAGENLVNIGVYMSDARSLLLPLVGGGDHDWNELFYRFGLLGQDSVVFVSTLTHRLGVLIMFLGLAWAAYFVLSTRLQETVRESLTTRLPALSRLMG